MSTELTTQNNSLIPAEALGLSKFVDEKQFDTMVKSTSFLPRLQLGGATSDIVKQRKCQMGNFAIVKGKDDVTDIGDSFVGLVVSYLLKAVDISDRKNIVSVYNPNDEEFTRIKTLADSKQRDTGCMWGPEYLLWLPDSDMFVTFFLSSPSARNIGPTLKGLRGSAVNINSRLAENKQGQTWYVPVATPSSAPITNMPAMDLLKAELEKFNNPKEKVVEKASEDEAATQSSQAR